MKCLFKWFSSNEVEEHNFNNCDRIEAYTEPQPALLWWHNLAIFYCYEDGNWYATCDKRFMGFKMENTIVRCKSEGKAREVLHELEYNPRYVEFRNRPGRIDCYFIDKGSEHPRKWGFFGGWGSKEFNCNSWRDGFFGDNAERK